MPVGSVVWATGRDARFEREARAEKVEGAYSFVRYSLKVCLRLTQ